MHNKNHAKSRTCGAAQFLIVASAAVVLIVPSLSVLLEDLLEAVAWAKG